MSGKLGSALAARLETVREHDTLDVNVFLKGEPARESLAQVTGAFLDSDGSHRQAPDSTNRDQVVWGIKHRAASRQHDLLAFLNEEQKRTREISSFIDDGTVVSVSVPQVTRVRPYWITNSVSMQVSPEMLQRIVERDDVEHVELIRHANLENLLDAPDDPLQDFQGPELEPFGPEHATDSAETTWGVRRINAPLLWQLGLTGDGVVVAVIDTGVNYHHPDLRLRMWDGGDDYPTHGFDFASDEGDPMDEQGHGTACAGIVAGDGTSGKGTGVAPRAKIMAIRVGGSEEAFQAGMQFAVDRRVHVISMSMSWKYPDSPAYPGWRRMSETIWAAGILHANSIGNQGTDLSTYPLPYNIATPGNCPPPWMHPSQVPAGGVASAIGCGATDDADQLATYSGRGPAAWEEGPYTDYEYAEGQRPGLIKPDVCAPGPGTISCNWRYTLDAGAPAYVPFGGTSAATPHVAGCLALLAHACIRSGTPVVPARVQEALESTAVRISGQTRAKENHYGAGRIDAYEAFKYGVTRGWWA
jgi:subtilisin family serine protease